MHIPVDGRQITSIRLANSSFVWRPEFVLDHHSAACGRNQINLVLVLE